MVPAASEAKTRPMMVAAAGALGAVTLLWVGSIHPLVFMSGTVLLTVCLVPMAAGMSARSGALLGLLFGVLWVSARLGTIDGYRIEATLTMSNLMVVAVMTTIGAAAGVLLHGEVAGESTVISTARPHADSSPPNQSEKKAGEPALQNAFRNYQSWLKEWHQSEDPWSSFDQHIRQLLYQLTPARHIRCFRRGHGDVWYLLNRRDDSAGVEVPNAGLINQLAANRQRYVCGSVKTPPMIRELAQRDPATPAWIVPVYANGDVIGVITAAELEAIEGQEAALDEAAELAQSFWEHVYQVDVLRKDYLHDRASGVLNRLEFMDTWESVIRQSYEQKEPVVVMVIGIEGLRRLDDTGHWSAQDEVIEAAGLAIRRGLRKEDLVGRFRDEQFVAVLRRVDVTLAELIARKLMDFIQEGAASTSQQPVVTLRVGLSGSGFEEVPPEKLLLQAQTAQKEARNRGIALVSSGAESDAQPVAATVTT